jgi:hypothetical protein
MAEIRNIKDFKDVKKAKVYRTHLTAILKVVNLSIEGLKHFEIYTSVREIQKTLRFEKKILESHLFKVEKLIKEKSSNE